MVSQEPLDRKRNGIAIHSQESNEEYDWAIVAFGNTFSADMTDSMESYMINLHYYIV